MTCAFRLPAWLALGLALSAVASCGATPAGHRASESASSVASPPVSYRAAPSCGRSAPGGAGSALALNAVRFVSPRSGWVVGSDRVLHTADGGTHWVTQYRTGPSAQLTGVDFTDAWHGWVTGASVLLATTDGGAHWQALPEPCRPIRAVDFVSPSVGFAVAGGSLPTLGVPAGGGVLLGTADGGRHWRVVASPRNVQSACFADPRRGWLGAGGSIYGTADGGRTWSLAVRGHGPDSIAEVACVGSGAGWAELIGPGAAMSHVPQIGYHTSGRTWRPIFAELYTASTAMRDRVRAAAPGVEPGPFSAVSGEQAVFVGYCAPCSAPGTPQLQGTAPVAVATNGGAILVRPGPVAQLGQANGVAFVSTRDGWVVGTQTRYPVSGQGRPSSVSRIMHTADGGRTWQIQYVLRARS